MQNRISFTLELDASTSKLENAIEALGKKLKPVNLPIGLDVSKVSIGQIGAAIAQVKKLRDELGRLSSSGSIKASVIVKQTVDGRQFVSDFKQAASEAKVSLRVDQAGSIGDIIAKKIAEGIEKSLKDVGKKSVAGKVLGAIGSVASAPIKIAGNIAGGLLSSSRIAATAAIQGLVNGVGIELTKGIGSGLREGIDQKISKTFGSTELIGKSAANQLLEQLGKAAQQLETRLESAESPFKGVANVIKSEFQRLVESAFDPQEILAVSRSAQRRARQQRGQVEAEAGEELLIEKQQETRKYQDFKERAVKVRAQNQANIQKLRDQAAAEAPGLEKKINRTDQQTQPIKQRLATISTARQQIFDSAPQLPVAQRPQAIQKFEALTDEAKGLEAQLTELKAEQDSAVKRVQQFTTEFERLEAVNQEIDQLQAQYLKKAEEATRNRRSLGTPTERRKQAGQELAELNKQDQAAQAVQQEIIEERAKKIEAGSKAAAAAKAAEGAGNLGESIELTAVANTAINEIGQLEQDFEELANIRKKLNPKIERLKATLKELPEELPSAVKQAYIDLSGKVPEPDKVPAVRERGSETLGTAQSGYFYGENTLGFRAETLAAINEGQKLTQQQLKELYEEVAHSLQLDAGRLSKETFTRLAPDANPQQIEPILGELKSYKPEDRPLELDAKIVRDQKVAQAQVRQELAQSTESVGTDGVELYKATVNRLKAAQNKLSELTAKADSGEIEFNATPFKAFVGKLADLAQTTSAEFARFSIEEFHPERVEALLGDVKKTLHYLDVLDADIAAAATKQRGAPESQGSSGSLVRAQNKIADLSGVVQQVGSALTPIAGVAEGTIHALSMVGKAGLALADKFGFAAASIVPGGALAYGPAKAVAKNVVGPLAVAGAASQVPGVGEVLGVLQHAIAAIIAPETVGIANGVSSAVAAELHSALPSLFSTLSRGLAESGLPGAGVSSQAVDAVGGLLVRTLEPAINGVINVADATIHTVGTAAQELLSQLGAALVAGKVVQEGAKLATSKTARSAALKGVETVGSGIGQVVGGVQEGVEGIREAVSRTSRAVDQNIQDIKQASERVAQGEIAAVGDIVEGMQAVASHVSRGAQDITQASNQAAQDVAQGVGKVVGVFADLQSVKLPDGVKLADLAQQQLIKVQEQLRQKLERVLDAEAKGLPVIGGSGTVRRDLEIVGQVLEAKYEVVIDHVADQVQKQIQAAPLDLPVKLDLPELEPILVATNPPKTQESKALVTRGQAQEQPRTKTQEQPRTQTQEESKRVQFNKLVSEVDAAIASTDDEVKRVYAYFSEIVEATKKAIKKGDVEAIAKNTTEAKRIAKQLATQIAELQQDIARSIPLLEENGIDVSSSSAVGNRLNKTKSALGRKASLIPQRLGSIAFKPKEEAAQSLEKIDSGVAQQINPDLAGITDGLSQKAQQLKSAIAKLAEIVGPKSSENIKDALGVLEITLTEAGSGISKEAEQAIAESEQRLAQAEKQFAEIERRQQEAERLKDRVEQKIQDTTQRADKQNLVNQFADGGEGVLPDSPVQNTVDSDLEGIKARQRKGADPSKTEKNRQALEEERLRKLKDLKKQIAQVEADVDKALGISLQSDPSKALIPIREGSQSGALKSSEEDISKALVTIQAVGKGVVAYDASIKQTQRQVKDADAQLKELAALLLKLKGERDVAEREVKSFQAEDLDSFIVPKQKFSPSGQERTQVLRERLLRDQSKRQIDITLKSGTAPKGTPDELQNLADSASSSFDKNAAKFEAAAERIGQSSTTAQKAFGTVGEGVGILKQKLGEAGGVLGILGKVGESFKGLAQKAGLPVEAIGKIGGLIKGVGIAALAYAGITQLGDAFVTFGRQVFEVSTRVETLQTQLKFVGGESNLPDNLAFIRKESERLKRPLDQVTEGLTQLTIATRDTSLESRTQEIARTIGTLGRVYGLSAENTKSIQYQLGQTIRLGRAQGDELRSISDAGINVQGALEKVLGKSGADVRKQLEAGQISATAAVDALKLLADKASRGLPEALATSAAALDNLNKKFIDVSLSVGEQVKPLAVDGINAVTQGLQILSDAGIKVAPIFNAIGQAIGLVLDIAAPIAGAIAAIGGAIASDLIDGAAIPFQIIGAGLSEIRKGFAALETSASQALAAIASQLPAGLGQILQYANPVTIAIRTLGILIGVNLVAGIVQASIAIVGTMIPALIGMGATIISTVIPAIGAAIAASLAFIATPLGATIAAIGIVAAIAAPHMDELAIAFSGLSQAQVDANNRSVEFNSAYSKGLTQLQKGIPLTAEKLKELKDGFAQNVKEGKDSAKVAGNLSAELDRLQVNAEKAAKIQAELALSMKNATEAIKNQSKAIDSEYNTRLAGLNESLAARGITQSRFDEAELAAQQEKTAQYGELYATQGEILRNSLAQAQAQLQQPIPPATRTEILKQVTELEAQINEIETKSSEQRIAIAKDRIKNQEKLEQDRVKLTENRQKIIENQVASGTRSQEDGITRIAALQKNELSRKIKSLNDQISLETDANGKLSTIGQKLYSDKRVFETELTKITAEELDKRIELESRYLANAQAEVADAIAQSEQAVLLETQQAYNAQQITQTQAEQARVDTTRQRLNLELELAKNHVADLEAIERSKSPEKAEEQERTLRTARLKTAQLVTQIAEQQQRDQEALTKSIQERIALEQRAIENLAERQTQAYERQLELLGKLNSALELQNKLIDSRKTLQGAIGDYLQTEYKILISTAKTDEEKQKLTQRAAEIEIKFLQERQRLDRESLEIKLRLQRLEDERSRIQNQSDQITAASNIKGAQAKLAEAEANPQSTKEELDALRLGVEAATSKLGAEQTKGDLLGTTAQVNREQENVQRRTLLLNQGGEYDQKRLDYAQTLAPEKQEKFIENLRKEITNRLKTSADYSPTRRDQEKQSVYTPTTYNTLGRFNPETGEIEQNPYPTPKDYGKSLSGQVKSMELPKDILSGLPGLTKAQSDTTDVLKRLEEKVLLSPILTELQRANNFAAGLSEHIGTLILRESKPAGTTNHYSINGRGKVLKGANI
jgi:tape measure domain-containing protein